MCAHLPRVKAILLAVTTAYKTMVAVHAIMNGNHVAQKYILAIKYRVKMELSFVMTTVDKTVVTVDTTRYGGPQAPNVRAQRTWAELK